MLIPRSVTLLLCVIQVGCAQPPSAHQPPCACKHPKDAAYVTDSETPSRTACAWGAAPGQRLVYTPSSLEQPIVQGKPRGASEKYRIRGFLMRSSTGCALYTSRWELGSIEQPTPVFVPCRRPEEDLSGYLESPTAYYCDLKDVEIEAEIVPLREKAGRPHKLGLSNITSIRELHGFPEIFDPEYGARPKPLSPKLRSVRCGIVRPGTSPFNVESTAEY